MGQSSSPRSHSSSSQGGTNDSHPYSAPSHSHTPSLDNTRSSNESGPPGHVNLAYQGTLAGQSSYTNRYPEDKNQSHPTANGVPRSPIHSSAPTVLHSSPAKNVLSGYEQSASAHTTHYDHSQRPKTPVFTEQRSKTPTNFDHQRQHSNPSHNTMLQSNNIVNPGLMSQSGLQKKPVQQLKSADKQRNTEQSHLNIDTRTYSHNLNHTTDQKVPGYGQDNKYVQEQRPKTPVGHEHRPTTPHEQLASISIQQNPPLSNGLSKATNQQNVSQGANITQEIKSWKVDSSGRPTNAVQQRMEQLRQKSKESHKPNYENTYSSQQASTSLSNQGNTVHLRQKSQEEMLQMQELSTKESSRVVQGVMHSAQAPKSPYLHGHHVRGSSNHDPHW